MWEIQRAIGPSWSELVEGKGQTPFSYAELAGKGSWLSKVKSSKRKFSYPCRDVDKAVYQRAIALGIIKAGNPAGSKHGQSEAAAPVLFGPLDRAWVFKQDGISANGASCKTAHSYFSEHHAVRENGSRGLKFSNQDWSLLSHF